MTSFNHLGVKWTLDGDGLDFLHWLTGGNHFEDRDWRPMPQSIREPFNHGYGHLSALAQLFQGVTINMRLDDETRVSALHTPLGALNSERVLIGTSLMTSTLGAHPMAQDGVVSSFLDDAARTLARVENGALLYGGNGMRGFYTIPINLSKAGPGDDKMADALEIHGALIRPGVAKERLAHHCRELRRKLEGSGASLAGAMRILCRDSDLTAGSVLGTSLRRRGERVADGSIKVEMMPAHTVEVDAKPPGPLLPSGINDRSIFYILSREGAPLRYARSRDVWVRSVGPWQFEVCMRVGWTWLTTDGVFACEVNDGGVSIQPFWA